MSMAKRYLEQYTESLRIANRHIVKNDRDLDAAKDDFCPPGGKTKAQELLEKFRAAEMLSETYFTVFEKAKDGSKKPWFSKKNVKLGVGIGTTAALLTSVATGAIECDPAKCGRTSTMRLPRK